MRILIFLILLVSVKAFAYTDAEGDHWVQLEDMIVPVESVVEEGALVRGVSPRGVRLWRNGILRYAFSSSVTQANRNLFINSCAEMGAYANISCLPKRAQDNDYIFVQNTNDSRICGSSYLGRFGGRQDFKINCWVKRTLQHEMMHALGLTHEHNRMDRDDHITIRWENIVPGLENNYQRVSLANTQRVLSYYDFESILQYDSYGGSVNGGIVMYKKSLGPASGRIYRSSRMSYGDHYILYSLYGGTRP